MSSSVEATEERYEKALKEERDRVAALDRVLGAQSLELQNVQKHCHRLIKENAAACLQLLSRAFIGTVEEGIADLIRGKTDPAVVSLVMEHHQHPLDTCARCGRPAPCVEERDIHADPMAEPVLHPVCAWGCPP